MKRIYTNKDFFYTDPAAYDQRILLPIEKYIASLWDPILLRFLRSEIKEGMVVADLGCGTFVHTQHMGKAAHIYAVDINREMLEYGRYKLEAIRDKVTVLCEDCSKTNIPDKSCDVVWIDGLSEFMNLDRLLAEVSRISKPKARFIILFHNRFHPFNLVALTYYKLLGKKKTMRSLYAMRTAAHSHGFRLERFESTGVFLPFPNSIQKYFIPFWGTLNKFYRPFQYFFPLGYNILCSFQKTASEDLD